MLLLAHSRTLDPAVEIAVVDLNAGGRGRVDLGPSWPLGLNDGGTVSGSLFKPWPVNFVPAIRAPSSQAWTEISLPEGFIGGHGNAIN